MRIVRWTVISLAAVLGLGAWTGDAWAGRVKLVWVGNAEVPGDWCDTNNRTVAPGATRSVRFTGQMDGAYTQDTGKYRMKSQSDKFEFPEPSVAFTDQPVNSNQNVKAKSGAAAGVYTIDFVAVDSLNSESPSKSCKIEVLSAVLMVTLVKAGDDTTSGGYCSDWHRANNAKLGGANATMQVKFTGKMAVTNPASDTGKYSMKTQTDKFQWSGGTYSDPTVTFTQTETTGPYLIGVKSGAPAGTQTIQFAAKDSQNRESATKSCKIDVAVSYGWSTSVTGANANPLAVTTPIGSSEQTISGHTLGQIVNDAQTKVRSDKAPCQNCHAPGKSRPAWNAASISKADFCTKVEGFNSASKPQVLKDLFNKWKAETGCQ